MIDALSLSQLAARHGGVLFQPDCLFLGASTDTRSIDAGDLFVALRGPNFDANDYLLSAQDAGACGVIAERREESLELPQLIVEDSLEALRELAAMNREKFSGSLVAITGSSGKTTVKEMLRTVLEQVAPTHATKGNLNNHIGVPLSLLHIAANDQYSVIEMGASGLGEIAPLSELAKPDVALVNNVSAAHLEGFGSLENVQETKAGIFSGLDDSGKAIVNRDCSSATSYLRLLQGREMLTFSAQADTRADIVARSVVDTGEGVRFEIHTQQDSVLVQMSVFGEHNVSNALAVTACALALNVPLQKIVQGMEQFSPVAGRQAMHLLGNGAELIDDSYNANPASVQAAIHVLKKKPGYKVLVLGDMGEPVSYTHLTLPTKRIV